MLLTQFVLTVQISSGCFACSLSGIDTLSGEVAVKSGLTPSEEGSTLKGKYFSF